ncbi:hypothetical protein LIER_09391 [Lithospermum erythrorhizon]|uniref:Uncharacterized protein n=1 Tax=Lithospermum erythrorhizon TaxID=34254 RepID=A0AAV3PGM6_LITER
MMGLGVVRKDHSTVGSSLSDLPPSSLSRFLTPLKITRFITSTCPLAWGYDTEVVRFSIPSSHHMSSIFPAVNYVPLSVISTQGTPNWVRISFRNWCPWEIPYNVNTPLIEGYMAQHANRLMGRLVRVPSMPLTGRIFLIGGSFESGPYH